MKTTFREIHRITTPLPTRPTSVHAYLVPLDAGGWMLVDGGIDTPEAWTVLSAEVDAIAGWSALEVHVVTHMHRDHIGLVQRVRHASSVPLALGELDAARAAHAAADPDEEDEYRDALLRRSGAPEQVREALRSAMKRSRGMASFVAVDHRIPSSGGAAPSAPEWEAVWTPGHTAGHISLFRRRDQCLIAGDAVLPSISPTIGVNRQRDDPVGDYFGTLDRLESLAPELILPGHGSPLEGTARIAELRAEASEETDRIFELLESPPRSAWELSGYRYKGRDLPMTARIQALRETLAHLQHLTLAGRAVRIESDAVVRYAQSGRG
ncbi:MAG: MBL fold metallo-hydrolase [Gemmatimonas sp.]|nr:MBL fold metallo-hydrolase [Gemmatimonas sp.]